MGFGRTVTGLAALSIAAFYLLFAGSLTSNFKWMCIAAILILTFSWITMGAPKQAARPARKAAPSNSSEPEPSVEEQEIDSDIPEPVTEKELDGATLRERKMAKIQSAQSKQEELIAATLVAQADTSEENVVEVTLEMEDVHVADEFVVEVSPESVENADIEMAISQRKIKHDEIRKKIEMRRRGQLADIRASTARMWKSKLRVKTSSNSCKRRATDILFSIHPNIQRQGTFTVPRLFVSKKVVFSNFVHRWTMDSNRSRKRKNQPYRLCSDRMDCLCPH